MSNGPSQTDQVLLRQLCYGTDDEAAAAFEALATRHYPSLYRYIVSRVRTPDLADDILQDVFFRLWRRRTELTVPDSVIAYLLGSARNAVMNFEISEVARVRRESEGAALHTVPAYDIAEQVMYDDLNRLVHEATAELPSRCREIFELVRYSGLSYSEVASTLGVSLSTVKTQMGRAIKVIMQKVGPLLVISLWIAESGRGL